MQNLTLAALSAAVALALVPVNVASQTAQKIGMPRTTDQTTNPSVRPDTETDKLENLNEIVVKALPLGSSPDDIAKPITVISGAILDDKKAATLGETIAKETGVHSSYFGPGVGRPIIRGLDGPRVSVLSNGLGTHDVSTVSQDHNLTIEPFLVDQIEILKGPSTLLYGNGAIGGVVNTVDGRIPEQLPSEGFSGRTEISGDTVNHGHTGMARIDTAVSDRVVFHADALYRQAEDYRTGEGTLPNSFKETRTGAIGGSWIGDNGFFGMSVSRYLDRYGNPAGHTHAPEEEEPPHADEHEHEAHEHAVEEETPSVNLALRQTRLDFKAGLTQPFSGIDRIMLRVGRTDYQHTEFEGDEAATIFFSDGTDGRLEVVHKEMAGWHGAFGLQFGQKTVKALGEEAFLPATDTENMGVFWLEQREWQHSKLELGARYDRQSSTSGDTKRNFSPVSLSAGFIYDLSENWHINFNWDRAQRAPVEEELFAYGPHLATDAFEIGDVTLGKETSNQVELGLHFHNQAVEAKFSVYGNQFDDYIFLRDTGELEDTLAVRQWTQRDARFRGVEGELKWHVADNDTGKYDLRIWGDRVRGTFTEGGGNIPRIPASRFGSDLDWTYGNWRAGLGFIHYAKVDHLAEVETPTPAYTLVNARIDYMFYSDEKRTWEIFANGTNLTDRLAYNSTSYIKDKAPLPGRGIVFGLRGIF